MCPELYRYLYTLLDTSSAQRYRNTSILVRGVDTPADISTGTAQHFLDWDC